MSSISVKNEMERLIRIEAKKNLSRVNEDDTWSTQKEAPDPCDLYMNTCNVDLLH